MVQEICAEFAERRAVGPEMDTVAVAEETNSAEDEGEAQPERTAHVESSVVVIVVAAEEAHSVAAQGNIEPEHVSSVRLCTPAAQPHEVVTKAPQLPAQAAAAPGIADIIPGAAMQTLRRKHHVQLCPRNAVLRLAGEEDDASDQLEVSHPHKDGK